LKAMRRAALETAAQWQWHDYRQALSGALVDALRAEGYAA
jgi:hypothetical protein